MSLYSCHIKNTNPRRKRHCKCHCCGHIQNTNPAEENDMVNVTLQNPEKQAMLQLSLAATYKNKKKLIVETTL